MMAAKRSFRWQEDRRPLGAEADEEKETRRVVHLQGQEELQGFKERQGKDKKEKKDVVEVMKEDRALGLDDDGVEDGEGVGEEKEEEEEEPLDQDPHVLALEKPAPPCGDRQGQEQQEQQDKAVKGKEKKSKKSKKKDRQGQEAAGAEGMVRKRRSPSQSPWHASGPTT